MTTLQEVILILLLIYLLTKAFPGAQIATGFYYFWGSSTYSFSNQSLSVSYKKTNGKTALTTRFSK